MAEEFEKEKLDSPLVVHKVTDASYQDIASEVEVDITHIDEDDKPTLERHRFKKTKKKSKTPYIVIAVFLAIVVVICALIFSGKINITKQKATTTEPDDSYFTTEENRYAGIITVQGTYLFFEGQEIDGIEGLTKEIKYLDEGTQFVVQDEKADSNFLNDEVLPLLEQYNVKYEVKHVAASGLTPTTQPAEDTTTEE